MDTDEKPAAVAAKPTADKAKDEGDKAKDEAEKGEKKDEPPKPDYAFTNMARVLPMQRKCITFAQSRFAPVKKGVNGGILLVRDQQPGAGVVEYLSYSTPTGMLYLFSLVYMCLLIVCE